MSLDRLPPVHPGEVLREDFLEPLGVTPYRLAKDIQVPATRVHEILNGRRALTADTALRLARYFGTSEQLWLNMQASYELQVAREQGTPDITPLSRPTPKERELTAA